MTAAERRWQIILGAFWRSKRADSNTTLDKPSDLTHRMTSAGPSAVLCEGSQFANFVQNGAALKTALAEHHA